MANGRGSSKGSGVGATKAGNARRQKVGAGGARHVRYVANEGVVAVVGGNAR